MLLHIWLLCSFLLLSSILPYEYTTVGLSINMLMDIWVVSSLELLEIQLQWMFIYQYKTLCEYMFLRFLGMKWLAHVSNFKKKPAKLLPRIAESFYISTYSFSLSLSTFGIDWSFKFCLLVVIVLIIMLSFDLDINSATFFSRTIILWNSFEIISTYYPWCGRPGTNSRRSKKKKSHPMG